MRKRLISGLLLASISLTGLIQTSCMGKFALLQKLYTWNKTATGNKFIDNLIFWILNAIPVYSVVLFVDGAILNLIEFWTGSNPLAMNQGDRMEKHFQNGENGFLAIATQNRMEIQFDNQANQNFALVFVPSSKSWMLETSEKTICMAKELDNNQVQLMRANGEHLIVSKDFSAKNLVNVAWQTVAMK